MLCATINSMISPSDTEALRRVHPIAKELAASNGFLLARTGLRLKARVVATLEKAGFEGYQYSVLAILGEGARQTQATIASTLGLDPSRMVAVMDALEEEGLIERQRDPSDRRRHVVSITADGKRRLVRLRAIMKDIENEYLAPLSADERETLHRLLTKLAVHNDPGCGFKPLVTGPLDPA